MAYTEFSTENADYVLQFSAHDKETRNISIFEGIDALVLETGARDPRLKPWIRLKHLAVQYCLPIIFCEDNKIPIFGVDIKLSRRYCDSGLFECIESEFFNKVEDLDRDCKFDPFFEKKISDAFYKLQIPLCEGRNAIHARKIEGFVVPRIKELSQRRHPKVGLIYGTAHIGLKHDLISMERRDHTIWNLRNPSSFYYCDLDLESLNRVEEARFIPEKGWAFTEHNTDLFRGLYTPLLAAIGRLH